MAKSSPSRLPYTSKTKEHPVSLSSLYSRVQNGSIRIVKTRGFDQNGLLECDLSIQELNREPYTAVSYTWDPDTSIWYGSPTVQTKPIKLNNCIVLIRHKVADILCLMHHLGRDTIWIDGLCINQDDPDDKRIQVGQMDSVYETAREVIAVISSPTVETDFLLDRKNWEKNTLSSRHGFMDIAMLKLMTDDYWRRTWILQELVLGRNRLLCCGNRNVTLEELRELCMRINNWSELDLNFFQVMRAFGRVLRVLTKQNLASEADTHVGQNNGTIFLKDEIDILSPGAPAHFRSMSFLDLWKSSGRFNRCFDPKDILYARRGLAVDGEKLIPVVDYSASWSVEDAYKHFAMRCITTASVDHLRVITHGDWDPRATFNSNLPSWVPDWRLEAGTWESDLFKCEQWLVLRWSDTAPVVSPDCTQLTVPGRILTTITSECADHLNETVPLLVKKAILQLHRFTSYDFRKNLTSPPAAEVGDLICLLKGCSALVYLHPVEDTETYRITAKYSGLQDIAARCLIRDLVTFDRDKYWYLTENQKTIGIGTTNSGKNMWEFRDMKRINSIPEVLMTIV